VYSLIIIFLPLSFDDDLQYPEEWKIFIKKKQNKKSVPSLTPKIESNFK